MRGFTLLTAFFAVLLSVSFTFGISISELRQTGTAGTVDEITGVVVMSLEHMDYHMGRLHIQDPSGELWGGIVLIDQEEWSGTGVLARSLKVGDSVTLYNVEYGPNSWAGNDSLYFDSSSSSFSITPGVGVPDAIELTPDQIFGGVTAEIGSEYQSMRVKVNNVVIEQMGIGRKDDNYAIVNKDSQVAWAADYANSGKQYSSIWWDTLYHHYTCPDTPGANPEDDNPYYNPISDDGYGGIGQYFASISGIMEKSVELPDYSYYQFLTVDTNDFEFAIPGDANSDGKVDGSDVTIVADNWQSQDALWWHGDFNNDGKVDGSDVTILADNWQLGVESSVAVAVPEPDGVVGLMAIVWLMAVAWLIQRRWPSFC